MAPIQKHTINKYQFDVVLQNEKDYSEISQTLTQLFYQALQGEIEKIFSAQSIPPELVVTLNQIEIDLGNISRENLEQEFTSKFIKALNQAIKKAILFNLGDSKATVHISSKELELIRHYIRLGTLPWWSNILMKSLDSVFRKLILSKAKAVRQLIFEEAIYPVPRSRIINHFKDPTIYALFGIISSRPADYYRDYTDNLIEINQHSKITNEREKKYKKVIQDLTFIYLLDQKGTSINQYEFFKSQLNELALKYELDYFDLVKQIFSSSQEILGKRENIRNPIVKLSKRLYEEEILLDRITVIPEEKIKISQKIWEELLTRGSSTIPFQKIGFTSKDEIFQWFAKTAPKPFVTRYRILGKEWSVRDRTINLFDDNSLAVLFEKAAPQKKALVFEVFEILETVQEEITPINQGHIAFKKVIRHFALELLVFQDLNRMTDEGYFQKQIQMFSKRYSVSEAEILKIFEETLNQIKGYNRGFKIIKGILQKSKDRITKHPQQERKELVSISTEELSRIFLELKKHYSIEIIDRIETTLARYTGVYGSELRDRTAIYFFIIKQLEKLTGENVWTILEKRLHQIANPIKKELKHKILMERSVEGGGLDAIRIEYLIEKLKETTLKEWILALGEKDAKEILIEIIFEKGKDLAEFVEHHKYDSSLSKILAAQLDLVEFRLFIKQFGLNKSNRILEFFETILTIQERWKIGRASKNQFEIFLKEQIVLFVQSGKNEEIELFVLDRMRQKGLINYKNLTFFREFTDFSEDLWTVQSIADLILDSRVLGRESIKIIQKIFFEDLVLHYLAQGSIPSWVEKDLYGVDTIKLLFNARMNEANVNFVQKLSEVLASQSYNPRILEVLEEGREMQFFKWLENTPGHFNITQVIKEIRPFFQISNLKKFDKKIFEAVVRYKIWLIPDKRTRRSIVQQFLLTEGFEMDSQQLIKEEWLFIFEFLFGGKIMPSELAGHQQRILGKIQKHPLRFLEALKKIPYPEKQLVKIFKQIPRQVLIQWIFSVLERGNFPEGIKNYGALGINYFKSNAQNQYLEQYVSIFLVHILFAEPIQGQRIRKFFEELVHLPLNTRSEIIEIFLKASPSGKKSLWYLYSRQFAMENTYRLPQRLKRDWIIVLHYLQYGSILFSDAGSLGMEQLREIFLRLLGEVPSFMRIKLFRVFRAGTARKNLSRLLKSKDVPLLLKAIHPDLDKDWNRVIELIGNSSLEQSIRSSLGWLNWKDELEAILNIWVTGNFFISGTAEILVPVIKKYAKQERIEPNLLVGLVGAKEGKGDVKVVREIDSLLKMEMSQEQRLNQASGIRSEMEEAEKSGVFINNAGLALLWPFLGRYFKRLNMIKEGDFISEDIRWRAVQLTQYLVTGSTEIGESELVLNRLLCGVERDTVIENDLDITNEEIALSDSLLQGVIYNWEKMRGTRPDTFRQTFLQRDGILRKLEDYYELRVEQKTYDMLLTTLPWNLSMIKLAWMKARLTVIWK